MTLRADIKYKSNWQQGNLKAQRRNKWICALKASMEKVKIYGPGGGPQPNVGPTKYTLVPYEDVLRQEQEARRQPTTMSELHIPKSNWTFADPNSVVGACLPSAAVPRRPAAFRCDIQITDSSDLSVSS